MRKPRFPLCPCHALAGLAAALAIAAPQPAAAQYIGRGAPPPLPAPPRPGQVESPAAALARALRTLAQSPRNFPALIAAGHAALDLGDTQSAIGFFGRAEEVRPSDPSPKVGMGAATVADGDAGGALRWFFQAQQLGATAAAMGADRGLAQDLLGNQAAAQADYRAALAGPDATEARRRLALSLGISGDRNGAFAILQPLLQHQDPAAQRIRAFVLALVGDERGASSAIDTAMPGSGGRMAGFFRLLPSLSAPQKAAAVHLGVFPDPSQIRVAAVSPRLLTPPVPERPAAPARVAPPPASSRPATSTVVPPPQPAPAASATIAVTRPQLTPPVARSEPTPVAAAPQPGFTASTERPAAVSFNLPSARAAASAVSTSSTAAPAPGDRLSGIDRLLAQADELPVPPAPRPIFETPPASPAVDTAAAPASDSSARQESETKKAQARRLAEAKKAADAKKVADARKAAEVRKLAEAKKVADAKKAADAKKLADEKREREAIGLAGTHWVQLAGGANADRMGTEFRRLVAKSSALRAKGGAVTSGKDYFRLLTGPFANKAAAQAFVNQLARDGVDGFSWTRTPAGIRIEKIAPK